MRRIIGLLLIVFLISGSGCKLIYKNRVPVKKPKKRYGWYKPSYKKRKRTKTVWLKVHKAKKSKNAETEKSPPSEGPLDGGN